MSQTIVLDPAEITAGSRTELDITAWIAEAGPNWGDAAVEQHLARALRGQLPIDFQMPNRQIEIPLILRARGSTTLAQIRASLQAKMALFQQEGGWLKLATNEGTWFADITGATLRLGGGSRQAHDRFDLDAQLVLEAVPDFCGAEVSLGTTTDGPELVRLLSGVEGNYPGRVRIVVNELVGNDYRGLLWGIRCRHYSPDATAELVYAPADLEPLDSATVLTDAVVHSDLGANWTPVVGTNIGGADFLTHTGSYRVWATVVSDTGDEVDLRFVYDVGDLTLPEENRRKSIPNSGELYTLDLGTIRLDPVPGATHRWQGQIQAKGAVGGETVTVWRLCFQPLDEGAGRLSVPSPFVQGLGEYVARDEFNQTAGNLTGKTLPVGGAWTALTGSDSTDFTLDTTTFVAQRTAVTDSGARALSAGTASLAAVVVQVDMAASNRQPTPPEQMVFARSDGDEFGDMIKAGISSNDTIQVNTGGVGGKSFPYTLVDDTFYTSRLMVLADGSFAWWFFPAGSSPGDPIHTGTWSDLATGGPMATGRIGFLDRTPYSTSGTRRYDNFMAWVPEPDAVLFADQSLELRTDGVSRETADGTGTGPLTPYGDLPRLPPSGMEDRSVELFLLPSKGDFDQLSDIGFGGNISAEILHQPSWVTFPG